MIWRLIDEEYTRHAFFGSRRRVPFLRVRGWVVNRKRVQRLMRHLGLAGMAPGPHTSQPHPEHPVYPYLLRGVAINRPHQAVEYGYYVHSPDPGIRLLGRRHGLV